jgi:hypothetical protein
VKNSAVLFFGKKPEYHFLQAVTHCVCFKEAILNALLHRDYYEVPSGNPARKTDNLECTHYTLYNGDFSNKKEVYLSVLRPVNHEIESWQPLEAPQSTWRRCMQRLYQIVAGNRH